MKKKIVMVLLTVAVGSSLLAGQAVMAAETKTENSSETEDKADAAETTEEKTIGTKPEKDTENVFSMKLKNLTGKVITEVTVKNEKDEKYPDNFLEKEDKFAADEERTLWFDSNAAKEADKTETEDTKDSGEEKTEVQKYDMQITFDDGTTATLHTLPFGDTDAAEIHLEGEVAYLVFESKNLRKSVNTKETEQALAPKPTEAPAQQTSSQTQDYSYDYDESYDDSYDYSYDYDEDYDYDESYDGYEDSDSGDSGSEDSNDGGSDDGCLDDAILN